MRRRLLRAVSQQSEYFLQVSGILLAKVHRFRIVLQVVIAIRQTQAALVQLGDHFGSILEILTGSHAKQSGDATFVKQSHF